MEGKILIEFKLPLGWASFRRFLVRLMKGPFPVFAFLIALVILSFFVLYYYTSELVWIAQHDEPDLNKATGFDVNFQDGIHKATWLPLHFVYGPHYQLAVAAASTCIATGIATAALYISASRMKQPLKRRTGYLLLVLIFIPTFALTTVAVVWNYVQSIQNGEVDGELLFLQTSPYFYQRYKGAWMDLEAWTCSVQPYVSSWSRGPGYYGPNRSWRQIYDTCQRAQKGRWSLLPMIILLVLTAVTGFFAVRAVDETGRRVKLDGESGGRDEGGTDHEPRESFEEGRVRLE